MSPEQVRAHARALLNSTDSLLGALLTVAQQLRESVAIMADMVDHAVPEKRFSPPRSTQFDDVSEGKNGLMTTVELVERLKTAGMPLAKTTIENYTTRGIIPTAPGHPRKRLYEWQAVLEALQKKSQTTVLPLEPLP